tara:strand:+ start:368 stop:2524 length:2157 start_codon:yes stop_codon:yes gene_type:complete
MKKSVVILLVLVFSVSLVSANWFTDLFNIGDDSDLEGELASLSGASNDGLVSYYKFDGDVLDFVGSNHGTNYGASFIEGKFGQALDLDGDDDYINLGDIDVINEITISAWINPKLISGGDTWNSTNPRYILAKMDTQFIKMNYAFRILGDKLDFTIYDNKFEGLKESSGSIKKDEWQQIMVTFKNNGVATFYNNGEKSESGTISGSLIANNENAEIGKQKNNQRFFTGSLDELKIWNRALSEQEAKEEYNYYFCKDSDGKDYLTKGTTELMGVLGVDFCLDAGKLLEYFCGGNIIKDEAYNCPNGCSGGKCLPGKPEPDPKPGECLPPGDSYLTLYKNIDLCPGEIYNLNVELTESGKTLDCHGAIIAGQNIRDYGVHIPRLKILDDITIKNCVFKNFKKRGLNFFTNSNSYLDSPENFFIQNVEVLNSGGDGIYIGPYSQNFVLDNVSVSGSTRVGIYLERESRYNIIKNSKIYNNGLGKGDYYREGIAIDASAYNNITNNEIYDNKLAGITLYKNCGECPAQIIRLQQSNYNTLQDNEIYNNGIGNQSVGIWIASRQGNYYSCCADEDYGGTGKYYDYAKYNLIKGNEIYNQYDAIKVQDDYNYVYDNIFYDNSNLDTWVGSDFKELVGDSIKGIELFKNEIRTNPEKEKLMVRYGSQVEFSNNVDSNGNCIDRYPGNCGGADVEPESEPDVDEQQTDNEESNVFEKIVDWFKRLF